MEEAPPESMEEDKEIEGERVVDGVIGFFDKVMVVTRKEFEEGDLDKR